MLDLVFAGQFELIFGYEKLVIHAGERIFDKGVIFSGAKKNSNGRIIPLGHHIFTVPAYISIQLANIFMSKFFHLQVNKHMAFQDTVVEDCYVLRNSRDIVP
ncbi:MAG: hypothetical protein BECKG1743F_GA0114225_106291 [Candidatus Kentron sp. G]|nr:MAG: hypothetical protein BECKG1743F_GA0114225_106291 [Candidatus Kentron sp. G]